MTDSEKLDFIIAKLEPMDQKIDELINRMESLENRVESLENRVESLEKRLSIVESVVADARRENRLVRSIVENEINYNISLIAEGHYDLNRKVDEAIHTTSDVAAKEEIYDVKFVIQGEKIRELSERMDIYATN